MAARFRQQEEAGRGSDRERAECDQPVGRDSDEGVGRSGTAGNCPHHARAVAYDQARKKRIDESCLQITAQGLAERQRGRGEPRDQHPAQCAEDHLDEDQSGGEQSRRDPDLAQPFHDPLHVDEMQSHCEQGGSHRGGERELDHTPPCRDACGRGRIGGSVNSHPGF
jgi:hypothetical protein